MIKLYIATASCSSCKKSRTWLNNHQIPFEEININAPSGISKQDFFHILSLAEKVIDEIISKRSDIYKRLNINFEKVSINEILSLINKHRSLLKRPIIVDEVRLQIGFNDDDIRQFIPRSYRNTQKEIFDKDLYEIFKNLNN